MPSLQQATSRSAESLNYVVQPAVATVSRPMAPPPGAVSYFRTATPSTGVSPDTLNLFQASGLIRSQRIIAVPQVADDSSTGAVSVNNYAQLTVGSSVAAVSTANAATATVAPTATNAAVTTPALNQSTAYQTTIQMGKTFVLLGVAVNAPARVQLYSTLAAQQGDSGRPITTAPTPGASTGLIADFSLVFPSESNWVCSPAVLGFNADRARSSTIYITITNPEATSTAITASLLFLPLEN